VTKLSRQSRPLSLITAALGELRLALLFVAILSSVSGVLILTGPLFMMQVYDRVLASRSIPTLLALSALALGLYMFLGVLELIRARILARIGQRVEETLSNSSFVAVLSLPRRNSTNIATVQPVLDLEKIRQIMAGPGLVALCDLPWLPLYIGILFLLHPYFGWLAVAGTLILIAMTLMSEAGLRTPTHRTVQLQAARSDFLEAGRRNAEALHAMGMRSAYLAQWSPSHNDYLCEQTKSADASSGYSTISKIFRLALQSAVLGLGAWLSIQQLVTPGSMIAASILTSRALAPIEQVISQWRHFVQARQAKSRLSALLAELREDGVRMPLPQPNASLAVSGLWVAAPRNDTVILRDINLKLSAGEGVGIIGPSGSGKTTLARALVGVLPAARGTIRLDGAELEQWDAEALGPSIGYLPQNIELLDGSIAANISRFDAHAETAAIIEAASLAGVHQMILSLPQGYDTALAASAMTLSAGQRQRIGLARALYGKPFLVVLDEPNASLDAEGENALANAIINIRKSGSIVVLIAHRANALAAVDHVLVLAGGQVVAFGARDEVLRKTTMRAVTEK
jgi:PrtD family type I secretion system ABC transporter